MRDFTIQGSRHKWQVSETPLLGLCVDGEHMIYIKPKQRGQDQLDTFIHEALHAENPEWDEKRTADVARFVTGLLWASGYRRRNKRKAKKP